MKQGQDVGESPPFGRHRTPTRTYVLVRWDVAMHQGRPTPIQCLAKTPTEPKPLTILPRAPMVPGSMLRLLVARLPTLRSSMRSRRDLVLENLALRQQLATLIVRWHRAGFRIDWNWLSRRGMRSGRPSLPREVRAPIRRMATENPWGAPRVDGLRPEVHEVHLDHAAGSIGGRGSCDSGPMAPSIRALEVARGGPFRTPGDFPHGAPHAITLTEREMASHSSRGRSRRPSSRQTSRLSR